MDDYICGLFVDYTAQWFYGYPLVTTHLIPSYAVHYDNAPLLCMTMKCILHQNQWAVLKSQKLSVTMTSIIFFYVLLRQNRGSM